MFTFTYYSPTRVHFGEGQIKQITNEIPKDAKILLVYGGGSIKENGVYNQVIHALKGFNLGEFNGIEPNPQYNTLMKAVELIKTEGYNYLLAVGGGSVLDGTKFIAAATKFKGQDPWDMLTKGQAVEEALPLATIMTLPATGSETNDTAVISRGEDKFPLFSDLIRPKFAILDPKTTLSLPIRQTINGIVDAYIHTIEQYLTYPVNAKVQDEFAEGLLRTLITEGKKVIINPNDMDARANIMWAATNALSGITAVGVPQDWATHTIGHEITAQHGVDHGRTLTIVLPALMKIMKKDKADKIIQYADKVFGITEGSKEEIITKAIEATEDFFKCVGAPVRLSDVNLNASHIDGLINALEKHGMLALGEKQNIDLATSRKILKTAL